MKMYYFPTKLRLRCKNVDTEILNKPEMFANVSVLEFKNQLINKYKYQR